jgi:hypothetical protein
VSVLHLRSPHGCTKDLGFVLRWKRGIQRGNFYFKIISWRDQRSLILISGFPTGERGVSGSSWNDRSKYS